MIAAIYARKSQDQNLLFGGERATSGERPRHGGPRHVAVLRILVEPRATVDLADRQGVTPLAHARARGFAEMVRILEGASRR